MIHTSSDILKLLLAVLERKFYGDLITHLEEVRKSEVDEVKSGLLYTAQRLVVK